MPLVLNTPVSFFLALLLCACTVPVQKTAKPVRPASTCPPAPSIQKLSDPSPGVPGGAPLANPEQNRGKEPPYLARIGQATVLPVTLLSERYLTELTRAQLLSLEQCRREVADLNAGRRLDSGERFRLAALLARDDHGDWERAIKALDGLAGDPDPRAQALVDTLKKSLRARHDLRQQTSRVTELQARIEQIKALEKDLQQRNEPRKTP